MFKLTYGDKYFYEQDELMTSTIASAIEGMIAGASAFADADTRTIRVYGGGCLADMMELVKVFGDCVHDVDYEAEYSYDEETIYDDKDCIVLYCKCSLEEVDE